MSRYERMLERKASLKNAEAEGLVADSHEVRMNLVKRMHAGELTLEQAQAELKRIKRTAKKKGLVTRNQASLGYRP